MKKTTTLILLMLMLTSMAGQALAVETAILKPTLLSYTPVPAQPGSYITATIQVTNDGTAPAPDAAIEFIDNYPFSVDNEDDKLEVIGRLGSKDDYLAEYRVRIDSEAVEGTNYLKVRYTPDRSNSDYWVEKQLPITISGVRKTVSINSVEVSPEQVAPGSKADVTIKVKNLASSDLKDVGVRLNLEGQVVASTYRDIPLAPIGSSIEKRMSSLLSGQTADFEFVLQAYPEAEAGIYKVPVTLSYTDTNGNEYTRNDLVSVVINGGDDLLVQVDDTTIYTGNSRGTVTLSITNKGFSEIKFLTVSLKDGEEYRITGVSDEVYLGNVDSDDYELAEFELDVQGQDQEEIELPVILTYKDSLNNEYEEERTLTLPIVSQSQQGQNGSNTGLIIVIIVAAGIIGYLIYRGRKRKKRK